MKHTAVLDLFLGDSGKGKIADYLAEKATSVIRFNGSNNAGHTLKLNGQEYKTHALPSGVLYSHVTNFIGHGCIINPIQLLKEIETFKHFNSKIFISGNAHMILPYHIEEDIERERLRGVGSTKQGVSPAFEAKIGRRGIQYKDFLLSEEDFKTKTNFLMPIPSHRSEALVMYEDLARKLRSYIVEDSISFVHNLAKQGPMVFEGAQGTFLDIDIGEYPFITSSSCTVGSIMTGTGLNISHVQEIIGVIKAYGSYVGTSKDFPDIEDLELNNRLRELGQEYGATTGRPRRLCWLDLDRLTQAVMINGPTKLAITRMDTLGQLSQVYLKHNNQPIPFKPWGDLKGITSMDQLPKSASNYLNYIEQTLNTPIWAIGNGPSRTDLIINERFLYEM